MNEDTLKILGLCDRVDIVSVPSGGYALVAWYHDAKCYLHHHGDLIVYESFVDAAESIKYAIRPGVPVSLPINDF